MTEVSGVRLMRQRRVDAVRDAMSRSRYIEIRGEAGVGKSGVLRRLAEDLSAEAQVLVLSPNRVIERGWLSMKSAIGYDGAGRDLMNDLSLSGAAIVFIDNLDFFADAEQDNGQRYCAFRSRGSKHLGCCHGPRGFCKDGTELASQRRVDTSRHRPIQS
jgi:hypothetical protein